jgi:hypothetical protein
VRTTALVETNSALSRTPSNGGGFGHFGPKSSEE